VISAPRVERIGTLSLYDFEPPPDHLCEDAWQGLTADEKSLAPKYFYDERGAKLFERICEVEEYYLTRTETSILGEHVAAISERLGPQCRIVEFGSGSGLKTRILLRSLDAPVAYVPVDISRDQLAAFALSAAEEFPYLEVLPVCADYTRAYTLPPAGAARRTIAFFPGSTIGNFSPADAQAFMARVRHLCGPGGGMLLGADLRKDPAVIERAYNDREGITAEFNLNLLSRINRECGADFDPRCFRHHAFFDTDHGRIVMRLVSRVAQRVRLRDPAGGPTRRIEFAQGEAITTEYSYKYTERGMCEMVGSAGWSVDGFWTDQRGWFGVWLLSADGSSGIARHAPKCY
jgi:dimethylhistidine N-methyltransferase